MFYYADCPTVKIIYRNSFLLHDANDKDFEEIGIKIPLLMGFLNHLAENAQLSGIIKKNKFLAFLIKIFLGLEDIFRSFILGIFLFVLRHFKSIKAEELFNIFRHL